MESLPLLLLVYGSFYAYHVATAATLEETVTSIQPGTKLNKYLERKRFFDAFFLHNRIKSVGRLLNLTPTTLIIIVSIALPIISGHMSNRQFGDAINSDALTPQYLLGVCAAASQLVGWMLVSRLALFDWLISRVKNRSPVATAPSPLRCQLAAFSKLSAVALIASYFIPFPLLLLHQSYAHDLRPQIFNSG